MVDIELLQRAYSDMSDQEIIKIAIEDKNNISNEALTILQKEIIKRQINLDVIIEVLEKSDVDFYKLFISNQNFAISNGSLYLINQLNKKLKKYSKKFNNEATTYLISRIKSHKTGIKILPEEEYFATISYLKNSNISEKNERELDIILNSTAEELLNPNKNTSVVNKSGSIDENDIVFNLHKAGNDLKKIGKYLKRYFVGQLLFAFGYVLQVAANGKPPSPLLLVLNGIAVIIIIIIIIEGFYNAGNSLLKIQDKTKSNNKEDQGA
jgi:hypothetical protein